MLETLRMYNHMLKQITHCSTLHKNPIKHHTRIHSRVYAPRKMKTHLHPSLCCPARVGLFTLAHTWCTAVLVQHTRTGTRRDNSVKGDTTGERFGWCVGFLTSRQHASVSHGRICSDKASLKKNPSRAFMHFSTHLSKLPSSKNSS